MNAYDPNNQVTRFTNNPAGDLIALLDGDNHLTRWNFDVYGRVTNKFDGLNREAFRLTYDPAGRTTNRWTPAGGNAGFAFDDVGNLKSITYSNTSPITLSYAYDAANRLTNMTDTVGTTKFSYTAAGRLETEDGPWTSDTLTYSYTEGQRTALSLQQPLASAWAQSYSYDNTRRLQSLVSPAGTFGYGYFSQPSTLVSQLRMGNGATITNAFDALAQLTNTTLSSQWRAPLSGFGYSYDKWGQRTNVARLFNNARSSLALAYDFDGQLIAAVGRESNGTVRLNEKFGYSYSGADSLASRTNNAQVQSFVTDAANQLTNVTRSGTFTVSGGTPRPATNVWVNASTATVYADATWASAGHAVLDYATNSFTVHAQHPLGSVQHTLNVPLPPLVHFKHDANGNLTNDQVRCFQYDGENQLTNVYVPGTWRTAFQYDGLNRRKIRREYIWTGSAWSLTNETRYLHDGLLVVQERDASNVPVLTYTRGLDLSGSLQGAGGIGGLLALSDQRASATSPTNYFYAADGSGNIVALLNYKNEVVGRYLYDPYGSLLSMNGSMAAFNRMRFSSKEWHGQSGVMLYEFRAYDPNLQRWITQDPIGETGGINLYRFVGNDPIDWLDPLGLQSVRPSQQMNLPFREPPPRRWGPRQMPQEEIIATRDRLMSRARPSDMSFNAPRGERQLEFGFVRDSVNGRRPCPPIVIGENMRDRVIPFAERNGFDYYRPGPRRSSFEEDLAANREWLQRMIREDRVIIDIGRMPGRPDPSPFYLMESTLINQNSVPAISFGGF